MPGHNIKLSVETYARVVLAASEVPQSVSDWMEAAATAALARHDYDGRLARFRQAEIRAAERLEGAPLRRDFGLPG